jgi:hypothetical protein
MFGSKRNLKMLTVNCRSIKDKTSEFTAAVNYIKPDIICGTESWRLMYLFRNYEM